MDFHRFSVALRQAKLAYWSCPPSAGFGYRWSPGAEEIFGMLREDVPTNRESFLRLVHADDKDRLGAAYDALGTKHRGYRLEYRIARRDGTVAWVLEVGDPEVDETGTVVEEMGTLQDISELKATEAALQESNERFRIIADSVPAFLWMSDETGRFTFVNKAWLTFTGHSLDSFLGSGFYEHIHSDDIEKLRALDRQATADRREASMDYRVRGADGRYRWYFDSWRPRFDAHGLYLGHIGLMVDISERHELETALRESKDQADLAGRAKTQFLANMSHELRTPLNAIIGFAQMIGEERLGPVGVLRYREYIRDIAASGEHLLSLVNDILDTTRIETGHMEFADDECRVAEIVDGALRMVSERALRGGVTLDTDLADRLPALWADRRALMQMLLNLLSNAVKFTPSGGRVTVAAAPDEGGGIAISVRDTGIGIPSEYLATAFQPFAQLDSSHARKHGGTGLGLYLTKAFIERHGGRIAIDSVLGEGTVVRLLFPSARVVGQAAA